MSAAMRIGTGASTGPGGCARRAACRSARRRLRRPAALQRGEHAASAPDVDRRPHDIDEHRGRRCRSDVAHRRQGQRQHRRRPQATLIAGKPTEESRQEPKHADDHACDVDARGQVDERRNCRRDEAAGQASASARRSRSACTEARQSGRRPRSAARILAGRSSRCCCAVASSAARSRPRAESRRRPLRCRAEARCQQRRQQASDSEPGNRRRAAAEHGQDEDPNEKH